MEIGVNVVLVVVVDPRRLSPIRRDVVLEGESEAAVGGDIVVVVGVAAVVGTSIISGVVDIDG